MKKLFVLTFAIIASVLLIQQTSSYVVVAQAKQGKSSFIHKSEGQIRKNAINRAVPEYPAEAKEKKVEGDVTVEIKVDEEGKVVSAKYVSGPEIFIESVEKAAKEWTFKPTLVNGAPVKVAGNLSFRFQLGSFTDALSKASAKNEASENSKKDIPEVLPPSIIRRSEAVIRGLAIDRVAPNYPTEAKEKKVEGDVTVEITIGEEGKIIAARVISGHELLKDAALEAAKKWTFKPTTLNDHPVKVSGVLSFRFKLGSFADALSDKKSE